MGIAKSAYKLLLQQKKEGILSGDSILQLGRQCVLFGMSDLLKCAQKQDVVLSQVSPQLSFNSYYKNKNYIDDITLFKALGFTNVHSLDYSDFEGANIVCDLNKQVDKHYWGKYDVIYDGGTAEHVFHFPQLLKNIHLMLKENGVVIHVSPSHNHVDHGFYMFSPQVFSEYYHANGYQLLNTQLFEYTPNYKHSWNMYHYKPGSLDPLSYGGFGKKMLAIHLAAQKRSGSSCEAIPQQGEYLKAWNNQAIPAKMLRKKIHPLRRLGISLNKKVKRWAPLSVKMYLEKKKFKKAHFLKKV